MYAGKKRSCYTMGTMQHQANWFFLYSSCCLAIHYQCKGKVLGEWLASPWIDGLMACIH